MRLVQKEAKSLTFTDCNTSCRRYSQNIPFMINQADCHDRLILRSYNWRHETSSKLMTCNSSRDTWRSLFLQVYTYILYIYMFIYNLFSHLTNFCESYRITIAIPLHLCAHFGICLFKVKQNNLYETHA